jgi:hypothetical protein
MLVLLPLEFVGQFVLLFCIPKLFCEEHRKLLLCL